MDNNAPNYMLVDNSQLEKYLNSCGLNPRPSGDQSVSPHSRGYVHAIFPVLQGSMGNV